MSIDIAYYPHVLDLVLEALYAEHDGPTLCALGRAFPALHALVQRKLSQHFVVRRIETGKGSNIERRFVWSPHLCKVRVLDVYDALGASPVQERFFADDFARTQPNTVRFFSPMHHRFVAPDGLRTAIFNVDIPDSGFATVYPDDDLIVACPLPAVPLNILHLRYDQRGMGDFGFAFETLADESPEDVPPPQSDQVHEVCVLAKAYDFGPRPKSPWRSTLLNQLATSALAYLHTHSFATLTLVGMSDWDLWCGSPFPDEEWEPTPRRHFESKADKVRYCWDWMFEHEFGRKYADIEDIKSRVRYETEAAFKERVGDELFALVVQPPEPFSSDTRNVSV